MPFCPKCKYEYVPGITTCPDCDLKLVEKLSDVPMEDLADEGLVCVATYPYPVLAQEAKMHLESFGIRSMILNEMLARTSIVATWMEGGIKLMVLEHDAARAKKVLSEHS